MRTTSTSFKLNVKFNDKMITMEVETARMRLSTLTQVELGKIVITNSKSTTAVKLETLLKKHEKRFRRNLEK